MFLFFNNTLNTSVTRCPLRASIDCFLLGGSLPFCISEWYLPKFFFDLEITLPMLSAPWVPWLDAATALIETKLCNFAPTPQYIVSLGAGPASVFLFVSLIPMVLNRSLSQVHFLTACFSSLLLFFFSPLLLSSWCPREPLRAMAVLFFLQVQTMLVTVSFLFWIGLVRLLGCPEKAFLNQLGTSMTKHKLAPLRGLWQAINICTLSTFFSCNFPLFSGVYPILVLFRPVGRHFLIS